MDIQYWYSAGESFRAQALEEGWEPARVERVHERYRRLVHFLCSLALQAQQGRQPCAYQEAFYPQGRVTQARSAEEAYLKFMQLDQNGQFGTERSFEDCALWEAIAEEDLDEQALLRLVTEDVREVELCA